MFDIGPGEFVLLIIIGILVVGPERLPGMIRQGANLMRNLRTQISTAKSELATTIGPQVDEVVGLVGELNPRRLLDDPTSVGADVRAPGSRPASVRTSDDTRAAPAPIIDADTP